MYINQIFIILSIIICIILFFLNALTKLEKLKSLLFIIINKRKIFNRK